MNARKLVKSLLPLGLFRQIEPYGHLVESIFYNIRYGFPAKSMRIIGVTGTNGKTTTSFMIHRMLREAGYNVALATTVAYGANDDIKPQIHHMTTVPAPILQRRLRDFKRQGVEWVVVETTSHALAQYRVWGLPYEIAVMTNITHEHLDYHRTFERYLEAKVRLFKLAARNGLKFGVANADDPNAKAFTDAIPHSLSYGIKAGQLTATNIQLKPSSSSYQAVVDGDTYNIICHIPGEFNVYNSLAAIGVGRKLGLTKDQIEKGIAALEGVEGRMTTVSEGQAFAAIVDYAHTPDSFEQLLSDVRRSTKGKLVVLFGSAAQRDEAKRALQGEIAGKYADEVIVTEEDDRDADGVEILRQIAEGAKKSGKKEKENLFLVHDRVQAINFAVTRVKAATDTVMFLGKGHEKTMEKADGEHPWDEVAEVEKAIRSL